MTKGGVDKAKATDGTGRYISLAKSRFIYTYIL